jgi:hypothetical protein
MERHDHNKLTFDKDPGFRSLPEESHGAEISDGTRRQHKKAACLVSHNGRKQTGSLREAFERHNKGSMSSEHTDWAC